MRITTSFLSLGIVALALMSACTVKDINAPAMSGPSTLFTSITMTSSTDTLIQDGSSQAFITVKAVDAQGNLRNIQLRAEIRVANITQDFGRLSAKQLFTNGTPLIYTAPAASPIAGGQVAHTVQIVVTPMDGGDFSNEVPHAIEIRLVPLGVILPTNPNLVASFTVNPASPLAFQTATFDAATTTNNGAACGAACLYSWDFGDGTSSAGVNTTHQFRAAGNFPVTLTVTDARGASTVATPSVSVGAPTPPTVSFTVSPTPAPTNVDVFFNASAARAATGRTITGYQWNFGDGATGSGVTLTHRYAGQGSYQVTLTVTDDAGATAQSVQQLVVGTAASGANAALTATTAAGKRVVFDAGASTPSTGATIVSYRFDYGDLVIETTNNPVQSHTYASIGLVVAAVEITDSNGKKSTKTVSVTVLP